MPAAEVAAAEVVRRVHPTDASERRRAQVVDYARRIVGTALGCEVRRLYPSPSLTRAAAASVSAKRSRAPCFSFYFRYRFPP
jgi:hypothetical protein